MRVLLQRVKSASVVINGGEKRVMKGGGLLIFVGITHTDTDEIADAMAQKCAQLRIFEDEAGKMNLSLLDTTREALVISQFTLYADTRKGRRPAFTDAARPDTAIPLYERFITALRSQGITLQTGVFGADMLVGIENDGPVTLMLEL